MTRLTPLEQALWALFEQTTASVEITDAEGRIEHVNPRFSEITGYTPQEARGRTPAELLRSNVHDPSFYETISQVVRDGRVWRGELIGRRKDGSLIHQLAKVVPVHDDTGAVVRHVAIKEPLYESFGGGADGMAVVLSRVHASELRYRTLVRSAGDAILVSDFESAFFVDANPGACELYGYTVEELRRMTGRMLTAPEESATVDAMSARLVTTGQLFEPQLQMLRKDGSRFWGSLRLASYEVQGQRLYVAIIRDVTEQVQRQQQLAESNRRLEQVHERLLQAERLAALGQLSATVAHEINNPLQFIDLNLGAMRDLLSARGVPHEVTEMLDDIRDGVDRISAITRDLASFTRTDPRRIAPVYLDEVVQRACRMAKNEIRHRAQLALALRATRPLLADQGRLTQLVTNLLVNAAHAIVEGHAHDNRIAVTTEDRGDALVLVVEDTGEGIPAAIRERIFDPFFTTKPTGRGGGMGLTVCTEIVRLHAGTIAVESEVGRGARFEVRLPFANGLRVPPGQEPRGAVPRRGRVLIIDDDDLVLRGLGRMLALDHEVVLANGGEEGLTILQTDRRFDVILCDLMMPVTDGPEVYAALTERAPELLPRVVFCSGGAFTARARGFVDSVPNLLLGKPMRRAELLEAIAKQMG
jgi:PAS domain S-box-containing protein